ncbi:MAG: aspartate 1-decarboxylase, partial [Proteobacteria bacterium]|nr:aspartate 1-decarboxylase [Pseudomonadota bacterium]
MQRHMFKSKLHRATVTEAELHYEGSLSVDQDLMDAAEMIPNEMIQVYNINNGER